MKAPKVVLVSAGSKIEARGKIVSFPTRDGMYLDFWLYNEESETPITDKGWYGQSVNWNYEIFNKYRNKPVKITIEITE